MTDLAQEQSVPQAQPVVINPEQFEKLKQQIIQGFHETYGKFIHAVKSLPGDYNLMSVACNFFDKGYLRVIESLLDISVDSIKLQPVAEQPQGEIVLAPEEQKAAEPEQVVEAPTLQ